MKKSTSQKSKKKDSSKKPTQILCMAALASILGFSALTSPTYSAQSNTDNASKMGSDTAKRNSAPDWGAEDIYWKKSYSSRPYYKKDYTYDRYQPAYEYGVSSYERYEGRPYSEVENDIKNGWEKAKGKSKLAWADAKEATRDAYERVYNKFQNDDRAPGYIDTNKTR